MLIQQYAMMLAMFEQKTCREGYIDIINVNTEQMSAPALPTDKGSDTIYHTDGSRLSVLRYDYTLFPRHRSTRSHMLILCTALSALSSLRAILGPLYISIAPDPHGTAGSTDKDVRRNATDRLALFMGSQGQEFIDIYVHHGVLSHFSSSADQSDV